jgi:hypothetical protein
METGSVGVLVRMRKGGSREEVVWGWTKPLLTQKVQWCLGGLREWMSEDGQTRTTRRGQRSHTYPRRQITTGIIGHRWPPRCGP